MNKGIKGKVEEREFKENEIPRSLDIRARESARHNENASLIVKPGLSWKCICPNKDCSNFSQYLIINTGFGNFDLNRTLHHLKCNKAEPSKLQANSARQETGCTRLLKALSFGFYKSKYQFYGISKENQKTQKVGETCERTYVFFEIALDVKWKFLSIECERLNK